MYLGKSKRIILFSVIAVGVLLPLRASATKTKKDGWDKAAVITCVVDGVINGACAIYQTYLMHRVVKKVEELTAQEKVQLKKDHVFEPQQDFQQDQGKPGNPINPAKADGRPAGGDPKKKLEDFIAGSIPPEVTEIISFLKTPERFTKLGARMPRGVLLVGPPGTGKTSIARAIANSAGCVFIHVNASEFIEKYVGTGARRIRELFNCARQAIKEGKSKSVIIFIDEIDAVGGKRNDGECREYQQTINQLLTEMDGFDKEESIVVIAATNRPDILDVALLRPGRFDRKVTIGLPDRESRRKILEYYCTKNKCPLAKDIDFAYLAEHTDRMSGAELQNLVNEAAIEAARKDADTITQKHFASALARLRPQNARAGRVAEEAY